VALFPSQYQSVAPYDAMIAALVSAGAAMKMPQIHREPPFVSQSLRACQPEA
jgi:hypothetical protein